jgi:hypothetical protein
MVTILMLCKRFWTPQKFHNFSQVMKWYVGVLRCLSTTYRKFNPGRPARALKSEHRQNKSAFWKVWPGCHKNAINSLQL